MSGRSIDARHMGVQWDVDRNTPIECDEGEVLIEEGFEEDDLIPTFQERGENGVLAWI